MYRYFLTPLVRKRGREMMEGLWEKMRAERKGNKSIGNDRGEDSNRGKGGQPIRKQS